MNLNKHQEFFDPTELKDQIHIIGCGAVGSTLAEQMARLGIPKLHLYDFDNVSEHNITNQMYLFKHIGKPKLDCLEEILKDINPEIEIIKHEQGWKPETNLTGYVFLAVDNIETRKQIVEDNLNNPYILYMFDNRMRLTDAQQYAVPWTEQGKTFLKSTMDFTAAEADAATPTSACGTTLNVTPTVRSICDFTIANFINITLKKPTTRMLLIYPFMYQIDAFDQDGKYLQ